MRTNNRGHRVLEPGDAVYVVNCDWVKKYDDDEFKEPKVEAVRAEITKVTRAFVFFEPFLYGFGGKAEHYRVGVTPEEALTRWARHAQFDARIYKNQWRRRLAEVRVARMMAREILRLEE
jgi:hypothetical protein